MSQWVCIVDDERRPRKQTRGRPPTMSQGTYMHVLIDHEMHDLLAALSGSTGTSKSELVRAALRRHLAPKAKRGRKKA